MAWGPGKYDGHATLTREATQAKAVVLLVFGGTQGDGFSVQTVDPRLLMTLPELLEEIAQQVRADMEGRPDG